MNGGVGPNSYVQKSAYQGWTLDVVKSIITDEIDTKLDVEQLCASSSKPFRIADFGCATGNNSFAAIQMNTCYSAYSQQFSNDIESFLECRSQEVVAGGMMVLLLPGVPHSMNPDTDFVIPHLSTVLGSCLLDMARAGLVSEAKAKSFNFPNYFPTPQEMEAIIKRSPSFGIERMEVLKNTGGRNLRDAKAFAMVSRSITEELVTFAFGTELNLDELYDRYANKLDSPFYLDPNNCKDIIILVILKRKPR